MVFGTVGKRFNRYATRPLQLNAWSNYAASKQEVIISCLTEAMKPHMSQYQRLRVILKSNINEITFIYLICQTWKRD